MARSLVSPCDSNLTAIRNESQLLRKTIDAHGKTYGLTRDGSDWCVKALHPSDPITEVRGIPDHSAVPSVFLNYQSTYTLKPSAGATGTWSFESSLLPHPVNFMWYNKVDSLTNPLQPDTGTFLNSQLTGATHNLKYLAFKAMCQRWRLAYMSVTCYQDGPDLANQGTITACQAAVRPLNTFGTFADPADVFQTTTLQRYTAEDLPNFDTCQAMPNAFFTRSREGAYVPLKLTESCQDWISESDDVCLADIQRHFQATALLRVVPGQPVDLYPHCTGQAHDLVPMWYNGWSTPIFGESTSEMMNGTFAHICARNLSVDTSFTFFFRVGIEVQVAPSSTLSPQQKLSPEHDPLALETYFAIARQLKDAYPAEYNDAGKIWAVLSKAGQAALPAISAAFPGMAPVARVATKVLQVGDSIASRRKKKKAQKAQPSLTKLPVSAVRDTPSLAQLERARAVRARRSD